jgi:predicted metal-dependent hydrolase
MPSTESPKNNVSTRGHTIEVRGLPVLIVRKNIKNLHLGVYPPDGRVRIAAPLRLTDEAVRLAVTTRLRWIRQQQARFDDQARQSEREIVTGESHYVHGRRYRLDVVERDADPTIAMRNNCRLEMQVRPGTSRNRRQAMLQQWYRQLLQNQLVPLVARWKSIIGVEIAEYRIKKMKTRWGSCNVAARRIWLNLELAKKPPMCLEYILVHEMIHLLERHHNERFKEFMDQLLPQWRLYRQALNSEPLGHDNWRY